MNWYEVFEYREGVLYWKNGRRAGSLTNKGYVRLRSKNKGYQVHRIVWEMYNGLIPEGMEIDHINHIRDDNRIENLRLVDRRHNTMNRGFRSDNSSGVMGVRKHSKNNNWIAEIRVNGKSIYLGSFYDFDDAVKARKEAEVKYGFHENHGK